MSVVAHMTYARRIDRSGRPLAIEDFCQHLRATPAAR